MLIKFRAYALNVTHFFCYEHDFIYITLVLFFSSTQWEAAVEGVML